MTNDNFDQRLNEALKDSDLDLKNGKIVDKQADDANASSGLAMGMRIGLEFMAGTVVGMGIGWGIDSYFDSTPWGLLIFTILGFCAGIMNVYRAVNNIDEGIGINRQNSPGNGLTKRE